MHTTTTELETLPAGSTGTPASLAPFMALAGMALLVAVLMALVSALLTPPVAGSDGLPAEPSALLLPTLETPATAAFPGSAGLGAGAALEDWCGDLTLRSGDACEVRELSGSLRSGAFTLEGLSNGSVAAEGWSGSDVRVMARVVSRNAGSAADARRALGRIETRMSAGRLEVEAPRRGLFGGAGRSSWSVDVRMQLPESASLTLATSNGAVAVAGIQGGLDVRSTNGAVSLSRVAAPVRARTSNGAVTAVLSRGPARGERVELSATNGAVELRVPEGVGAEIEARTTNGRITSDLPLELQGTRQNQARGTVGGGGGEVHLRTTNGPIRIRTTN